MHLVSIIIPVYNADEYLEECANSLLNQTYTNIEIILIDDGSIDSSLMVCKKLANADKRVKVIHQSNGGISAARNTGIDVASGEYLMFCDNDDLYLSNAVEKAVYEINDNNVMFIKYGVKYITVNANKKVVSENIQGPNQTKIVNAGAEFVNDYSHIRESKTLTYVWNGIYKASFIKHNNIRFDSRYIYGGEDFDFNLKCVQFANTFGLMNEVLYIHYKRTSHSTAAKYNRNQIDSVYLNANRELQLFEKKYLIYSAELKPYLYSKYVLGLMSIFSNPACDEQFSYICKEYKKCKQRMGISEISFREIIDNKYIGNNIKRRFFLLLIRYSFYAVVAFYILLHRSMVKKEEIVFV